MEASCQGKGQQLTILYSGSVSIFHNVPADKAQAVMLLLSKDNGSTSKSSLLDFGKNPLMQAEQPQLSAKSGVVEDANPSYPPPTHFPPQGPLTRTLTPTTDDTQITQFMKRQAPTKRSQAELPFARKASLARFLEKRKDRVSEAMKRNDLDASAASADSDDVEVLGCPSKRLKLP